MNITGTGWNSNAPTSFALNSQNDELFAFQESTITSSSTTTAINAIWSAQSGTGFVNLFGVEFSSGFITIGTASASNSYQPSNMTLGTNLLLTGSATNGNCYFANGTSSVTSLTLSNTKAGFYH